MFVRQDLNFGDALCSFSPPDQKQVKYMNQLLVQFLLSRYLGDGWILVGRGRDVGCMGFGWKLEGLVKIKMAKQHNQYLIFLDVT